MRNPATSTAVKPLIDTEVKQWTEQDVLTVATSDFTNPTNAYNALGVITYRLTPEVLNTIASNPTSNAALLVKVINKSSEPLPVETQTAILNNPNCTSDVLDTIFHHEFLNNRNPESTSFGVCWIPPLTHHAIDVVIARQMINSRQLSNAELMQIAEIAIAKDWVEIKNMILFGDTYGLRTRDGEDASEVNGFVQARTRIVLSALNTCGFSAEEINTLSDEETFDLYKLIVKHSLTREHFDTYPIWDLPDEVISALVG